MADVQLTWIDARDGLIITGDVLDGLARLEDESVEAIITDPPYELAFMNKGWDQSGVAFDPKTWEACKRVLKPGGHLIAFGGTRTHHRMWTAVEDAGFEIRDMIVWLYGQGMPKSLNLAVAFDKAAGMGPRGKGFTVAGYTKAATVAGGAHGPHQAKSELGRKWQGWGTGLKPAWEPILLARKPLSEDTVAANTARHGTGAMNVDATRITVVGEVVHTPQSDPVKRKGVVGSDLGFSKGTSKHMQEAQRASVERTNALGRWPANVILECICEDTPPAEPERVRPRKGEKSQDKRYTDKGSTDFAAKPGARRTGGGVIHTNPECPAALLDAQTGLSESSGVINRWTDGAKPFGGGKGHPYETVPGHQDFGGASRFFYCPKASGDEKGAANGHPTVKPLALMRYLIRLVTPPEGVVLDPFCGSGSTLVAALQEGFGFIGIDLSLEYTQTALGRINSVQE